MFSILYISKQIETKVGSTVDFYYPDEIVNTIEQAKAAADYEARIHPDTANYICVIEGEGIGKVAYIA